MRRPSTNSKQRIATVSIRKEGDSTERFSMKVPLSVNESGDGGKLGEREPLTWTKTSSGFGTQSVIKKDGILTMGFPAAYSIKHDNIHKQTKIAVYINGQVFLSGREEGGIRNIPVKKGDVVLMGYLHDHGRYYGEHGEFEKVNGYCTGRAYPFRPSICRDGVWLSSWTQTLFKGIAYLTPISK